MGDHADRCPLGVQPGESLRLTGEWTHNRLLQTIVLLYSLYVAGLWLTNTLLYFQRMSLTYGSVVGYYLGSE